MQYCYGHMLCIAAKMHTLSYLHVKIGRCTTESIWTHAHTRVRAHMCIRVHTHLAHNGNYVYIMCAVKQMVLT